MWHFIIRLFLIVNFLYLGGCAQPDYFQNNAIIQAPTEKNLPPAKNGYVWATAGKHYQRSRPHSLIWGKHYRRIWAAPVQAPLLDLKEIEPGLSPTEMGGGLQSTSLTLGNASGQTYTLRTLDKDPAKSLSPFWQKTFLSNLMRDQTSALNPYAAFIIPPLAKALDIFHTNPTLYYVPEANTSGLGKYHQKFSGKLTLLEEKFINKNSITPALGPAQQIINSKDLFTQLELSPENRVNQLAFARARLLDVLLGDLDRHEGQWNWAAYPNDQGGFSYKPIPKDRDYALYQFADGFIPWLITRRWLVGKIPVFIHNIPDVGGLIYKGRKLDQKLLNQVTAAEWEKVARDFQTSLTKAVINEAVSRYPDSVYQLIGKQTAQILEKRIKMLPKMAAEYYSLMAKEVFITGTQKKVKFVVQITDPKTTVVEVLTIPDNPGTMPTRIYKRVFTYPETKTIVLEGLGNNDEFDLPELSGKRPKIKIKKAD